MTTPCTFDCSQADAAVGAGIAADSRETTIERDRDFRDLVCTHQKSLHAFILRRIGNATEAEELTQQTFVSAAASIATFRGESALSTWLYGVAMNLVRNHLSRDPARRHHFEDSSVLDGLGCSAANPEERLQNKQQAAALEQEMRALPAAMRDVLMLVGINELAYEDAAVLLNVPVGTVRSRVSRARDLLRKRLAATNTAFDI